MKLQNSIIGFLLLAIASACSQSKNINPEFDNDSIRSALRVSDEIPAMRESESGHIVRTNSGFIIEFNRSVEFGRYVIPPNPYFVRLGSGPIEIVSITHPNIPSSAISVSFPPENYASTGQPYDPAAGDFSADNRLSFPFTLQPGTQAALHITTIDQSRKDQGLRPHLSLTHTEFVRLVDEVPYYDELMPPVLGHQSVRNAKFRISEMVENFRRYTPIHEMPQALPLTEVLPNVCRWVHSISGFSNLSGGQDYVSGPIGTPESNGSFTSTYGAYRAREMSNYLLAILNPEEPLFLRQIGMACFLQNVAMPGYLGAALSDFPTSEGGGHGGGIMMASFLVALMFPSVSELREDLRAAIANSRFSESTQVYQSPIDNKPYYGSPPWGTQTEFPRCAVGSFLHWSHGNWTYCIMRTQDPAMHAFDSGTGGGYQEISAGMFLNTVFYMEQLPGLRRLIGYELLPQYIKRYLRDGTQSYNPQLVPQIELIFLSAIDEHNAVAVANEWPILNYSVAQQRINDMQAAHGYFAMSHTHGGIYQWLLEYYGIKR